MKYLDNMKDKLDKVKRTRFKIAIGILTFLAGVTVYALYKEANSVASTAIGGVLTVATGYIIGDSYRKSDKK